MGNNNRIDCYQEIVKMGILPLSFGMRNETKGNLDMYQEIGSEQRASVTGQTSHEKFLCNHTLLTDSDEQLLGKKEI